MSTRRLLLGLTILGATLFAAGAGAHATRVESESLVDQLLDASGITRQLEQIEPGIRRELSQGAEPAERRFAPGAELELDESLLTGESLAVARRSGDAVYSGTLVVRGQARGEVFATGPRSELGRIGVSLASLDSGKTSLQLETARIVKRVALFALEIGRASCRERV